MPSLLAISTCLIRMIRILSMQLEIKETRFIVRADFGLSNNQKSLRLVASK
jgi:hypothetical protein